MGADSMNDAGRIGFIIRGDYDNTATYDFLDVVYYGNSSYVAKKITIGNVPENDSEYWHILATSPDSSVTGIKGAAEANFRTGNVIISPQNIGLGNVNNTPDNEKNVLSATSATKLSTENIGSSTKPTYFKNGVPVACSYSLSKSVPENAVFTDTLKNAYPLTVSKDGVNTTYDGSASKTVTVPVYKKDKLFSGKIKPEYDTNNNSGANPISITVNSNINLNDYFMFEIYDTGVNNYVYLVANSEEGNVSSILNNISIGALQIWSHTATIQIIKTSNTFMIAPDPIVQIGYFSNYTGESSDNLTVTRNMQPVSYGITAIYGHKIA